MSLQARQVDYGGGFLASVFRLVLVNPLFFKGWQGDGKYF